MKNKIEHNWDVATLMKEFEKLGTSQTKKTYMRHGAKEPLFGLTTKVMKPIAKQIKKDHALAMDLYATGNYDAMYFAGMIADVNKMNEVDFEVWMQNAYCHALGDYVVAVSLAEAPFAQSLAISWIASEQALYQSAGWACFGWLLAYLNDDNFDKQQLHSMLDMIKNSIHEQANWTKYNMNAFVMAVAISYLPLHEEAVEVAKVIGKVVVDVGDTSCKIPDALVYIEKVKKQNRLGFKRKYVRC